MDERAKKLCYSVNVPFDINLNFLLLDPKKETKGTYFVLNSIVVHVGSGLQQGHYFSLVNNQSKWFRVDDEVSEEIDISDVYDYMGNPDEENPMNSTTCAYLLFYIRQQ